MIPVYEEGEEIVACLDRILAGVTLPCEVLVVYDDPADTTVPYLEKYARDDPRSCRRSTTTAAARRAPSGAASSTRGRRSRSSPWPTAATIAEQIDELCKLVERGVVDRRRVAVHERRPADRRTVVKSALRGSPGCRSTGSPASAPATPPTRSRRTRPTSCARSASTPTPASRSASSSSPRRAGCGCRSAEIPTIWLERAQGTSNFKVVRWLPRYLRWYRFAFGPQAHARPAAGEEPSSE